MTFKLQSVPQKERTIRIINDTFAQCEACSMWVRLYPVDETNMRTVPLTNIQDIKINTTRRWICFDCHDDIEERYYDADLEEDEHDKFFLGEVDKERKKHSWD